MKQKVYYLSSYYSSVNDYHKNVKLLGSDFSYIKEYYQSLVDLDLTAFIFIDQPNTTFITKFETEKIRFFTSKVIENGWHLHDVRFVNYYQFLVENPTIEYVAMTDISDVVVIKDCFPLIESNKNVIFIGQENAQIGDNLWFNEYLNYLGNVYEELPPFFHKEKTILNCGILCGHRIVVLEFLSLMLKLFQHFYEIYPTKRPLDMYIVNYVAYTYFSNRLYNGKDLNTKFGHYEFDKVKFFKHK